MDQHADFITVATPDLDAARAFYVDGLGWEPTLDVPGEIIFFQVGHGTMLGLYEASRFVHDLDPAADGAAAVSGVTLSHNVGGPEQVDAVVEAALRAGATVLKPPQRAAFGGYHGHFTDPNGLVWEVAHNPGWQVDEHGKVSLGALDDPAD